MRYFLIAGSLVLAMSVVPAAAEQQADPAMDHGAQGVTIVRCAQVELTQAGLYGGPHHGVMTADTEEAVEDFEHLVGWPESGRVTPDLVNALRRYNLLAVDHVDNR